jgi:hypothetical protein
VREENPVEPYRTRVHLLQYSHINISQAASARDAEVEHEMMSELELMVIG